jgi:ATP-binding cassette subfamily B protein
MRIYQDKQFGLFLKFVKYLLPYWKKEVLIFVLSGAAVLLALINPYLTKLIIDKAIGGRDLNKFIILILIGAIVFIVNGLARTIKDYLERVVRFKLTFDLSKKTFGCLERRSLSWFRERSSGEHLYKINYDIDRIAEFITAVPPQIISVFFGLIFTLAIVFYLNWQMAVLSLLLIPFLYLLHYYLNKRMKKDWEELVRSSENIFKRLAEVFSRIQLIKVFGTESVEIRDYLKRCLANITMRVKNARLEIMGVFAGSVVNKIIFGFIAFYGGYQVIKGNVTLGSLTAIVVYLNQLLGLEDKLAVILRIAVRGSVSCNRIDQILNDKSKITESPNAKDFIFKKGRIEFKNVGFGYEQGIPILTKLNFEIEGGSYIAIVGRSGSGKTTLLNLILRLYNPWQGDIFIDGCNIKDLKFSYLKGQIGIAMQESFLWNDSILNNIKYAVENVTIKKITEVAGLTGVDEFVGDLPFKYETIIGENACKLSEGQKQRIAIARALIKNPKILILDEAMSSMDSLIEERIIKNIKETQNGVTLIVVSHRLSTIMMADLAYFLKKSDEVIIGKPQQLLEKEEAFYNLFATQIKECV